MFSKWKTEEIAALFLTALFIFLLFFRLLPMGIPFSPDFHFYRISLHDKVHPSMIFFGLAAAFFILFVPRLIGRIRTGFLVFFIMLLCVVLNLNVYRPIEYSWSFRILYTTDANLNPFFDKGRSIEKISQYHLLHLEKARQGFMGVAKEENRLTTHPPGLPVFYALLKRGIGASQTLKDFLARLALCEMVLDIDEKFTKEEITDFYALAAAAALLCVLALALIPFFVFLVIWEIGTDKNALMGAAFSTLVPSFHIFSQTPNIYFPPLALLIVYCCVKGMKLKKGWLLFLCGALTALALFLTFEFLPILLFSFLLIALEYFRGKESRELRKNISSWACGGISVYLIYLLWGYGPVGMFFTVMKNNHDFYAWFNRRYLVSVPFNVIEFCAFSGALCFSLFFIEFFTGLKKKFGNCGPAASFSLALGIVFLLFLVSGSVRGELARNCMSFMPLFVISVFANGLFSEKFFYSGGMLAAIYLVSISSLVEVTYWFHM